MVQLLATTLKPAVPASVLALAPPIVPPVPLRISKRSTALDGKEECQRSKSEDPPRPDSGAARRSIPSTWKGAQTYVKSVRM